MRLQLGLATGLSFQLFGCSCEPGVNVLLIGMVQAHQAAEHSALLPAGVHVVCSNPWLSC